MPLQYTIPAIRKRVCEPCEYHKCTGSFHVRVGNGGYREYACMHPKAFPPIPENAPPEVIAIMANAAAEGRPIGKTEDQPNWCPLTETNRGGEG